MPRPPVVMEQSIPFARTTATIVSQSGRRCASPPISGTSSMPRAAIGATSSKHSSMSSSSERAWPRPCSPMVAGEIATARALPDGVHGTDAMTRLASPRSPTARCPTIEPAAAATAPVVRDAVGPSNAAIASPCSELTPEDASGPGTLERAGEVARSPVREPGASAVARSLLEAYWDGAFRHDDPAWRWRIRSGR